MSAGPDRQLAKAALYAALLAAAGNSLVYLICYVTGIIPWNMLSPGRGVSITPRLVIVVSVGGALAGLSDLLDRRELLGVSGELGRQQLRVAEDCRQQVVEVVGDAPGQLADCLHLLGDPELFRHRVPLRDVAEARSGGSSG